MKYVIALDLSLSSTGVAIFREDGTCVKTETIETSTHDETPIRLKRIASKIKSIKKKYQASTIIIEQGFSRFNISTQQLFRVHGLINYLFCDTEQKYYHSTSVRKVVLGKGNAKKEEVRNFILEKYNQISFNSMDESDAFAAGLCFFIEKGILQQ